MPGEDVLSFRLLGPIEVWREDRAVRLNGRKARAVLATLMLHANRPVLTDRLVAMLWGEFPPVTAVAQVHKYVSQLRSEIGQDCITRSGTGYSLRVDPSQVDLLQFDEAVAAGRTALAEQRTADALHNFYAALALWRGDPLADVTDELLCAEGPALEERRITTLLDRIDTELLLGRHADIVGELRVLVAEHPLREKLRERLMLALYRSGRVAEALSVFETGRHLLAEEFGLDPGPGLRRMHEAILAADPSLEVARSSGAPARPPLSLAQLPPSIADFTGRAAELARIEAILSSAGGHAPELIAISGKGGVGKTTLAVHAARRSCEAYPDGQLYARLRGPKGLPLEPLEVLKQFLRSMGGDPALPDGLDECAQLFRARSAARRMLVVLDDASTEAQVRPLLPGSPTCTVLVTSRPRLTGLEGAHHVELDVFDTEESIELLARIIGPRGDAEHRLSLLEIVRLCGRLPLAVRIAAARFAQHRRGDLASFVRRLTDERRRLDVLVAGDLQVRASMAIGYEGLAVRSRRAFCMLSLIDAPDFAAWVLAPLLGATLYEAEDLIEDLVNAQLLDIVGCDATGQTRYRYHDLVRLYARERAEEEYDEAGRSAAVVRVLGAWLTLASEADGRLHGTASRGWSPRLLSDPPYYDRFDAEDIEDILASPLLWFEAERPALTVAVEQAVAAGYSSLAWALADSMTDFLELRNLVEEWQSCHSLARQACADGGDRAGSAVMLLRLARTHLINKEPDTAFDLAETAVETLEGMGVAALHAEAYVARAAALRALGEHDRALAAVEQAVTIARASSNRVAEAKAAHELGTIHYEREEWEAARVSFLESARIGHELGHLRHEALSLRYAAVVLRNCDQPARAREAAEAALAAFRELGDRPYEAFGRLTLSLILLQLGDPSARRMFNEGHTMLREMELEYGAGETLYAWAALELAEGRTDSAIDQLTESIDILSADPVHHLLVSAVERLAQALAAGGRSEAAEAVKGEAAALAGRLGRPVPVAVLASIQRWAGRKGTGRNPESRTSRLLPA
jgi:DNA-binding SARP family transcriptional activator/tetratricopeptide (TPR) repeat protein